MTAFTDDDLKRLKEVIQEPFRSEYKVGFMKGISIAEIEALLARLEAAERALNLIEFDPESTKEQIHEALERWLIICGAKAAGKDKGEGR